MGRGLPSGVVLLFAAMILRLVAAIVPAFVAAAPAVALGALAGESASPPESVPASAPPAAPPASASPPSSAPACLPACREGYVCIVGLCVSACNPTCADDEICTSEGTCRALPPPPLSPPVPPPRQTTSSRAPPTVEFMVGVGLGVLSGTYSGKSMFESGNRSATSTYPYLGPSFELGVRLGTVAHFFAGLRVATNLSRTECLLSGLDVSFAFGGAFFIGPEAGVTVTGQKCGVSADITKGSASPTAGTISYGDAITAVTVGGRAGLRISTGRRRGALVPELRFYTNAATLSSSYVSLYPTTGASDRIDKPNMRWYGGTLGFMYAF